MTQQNNTMAATLIKYAGVEIRQEEQVVLSDVNFEIGEGEWVYLLGRVGSGKSSLLKTFYGSDQTAQTPGAISA